MRAEPLQGGACAGGLGEARARGARWQAERGRGGVPGGSKRDPRRRAPVEGAAGWRRGGQEERARARRARQRRKEGERRGKGERKERKGGKERKEKENGKKKKKKKRREEK